MFVNDLVAVTTPLLFVPVTVVPAILTSEIDAEFFGVAVKVHLAVDLYLINLEASPVRAIVVLFVSTTDPVTVGVPVAVTVIFYSRRVT